MVHMYLDVLLGSFITADKNHGKYLGNGMSTM